MKIERFEDLEVWMEQGQRTKKYKTDRLLTNKWGLLTVIFRQE